MASNDKHLDRRNSGRAHTQRLTWKPPRNHQRSRALSRAFSLALTVAIPLSVAMVLTAFNSHARPAEPSRLAQTTSGPQSANQTGSQTPAVAASAPTPQAPSPSSGHELTAPTPRQWIDIHHVDLGVTDSVTIHVRTLHGEVLRTSPAKPATLDDPLSFRIRVTSATVGLTGADLGGVLNTVVFAYPNAPLRDLQVRTDGDQIIQTGVIHKGVDFKFRLHGTLTLMPDGRIRIHPTAMRILGINGEKVLSMVGLHLDNIIDLKGAKGATVKGDDLFLDPMVILPPPAISGTLASIRIEGDQVVQEFVRSPDDSMFGHYVKSDTAGHNFIYFRGGELRFGKLLMNDTDLRIMGPHAQTPFDMNLLHYSKQLVAGQSHTLANEGLLVNMPDYATLGKSELTKTSDASIR
jgi:hypothetical protein